MSAVSLRQSVWEELKISIQQAQITSFQIVVWKTRWKRLIPGEIEKNGAADIFLEIITQPFLGFDGIVPGSSNQATV